ncbi:MAG: phosphatase PAP2 family protein [Cyanobacteria bacterium P01_A01_bin.114]
MGERRQAAVGSEVAHFWNHSFEIAAEIAADFGVARYSDESILHPIASLMEVIIAVQTLFGPGWQAFFLGISALSSQYTYMVIIALYYWLVSPSFSRQLGMALALSYLDNLLLKELFAQPRPFELNPDIAVPLAQSKAEGPSFPSGHTQGAATFWLFLALQEARLWPLSLVCIGLVAVSRIYLGVHFGVDVLAGGVIGLIFAWLGVRWLRWPRLNPKLGVSVIFIAFISVLFLPTLAAPMGVMVGFWLAAADFKPPTTWPKRAFWAVGGLGLLWVCLLGLGALFDQLGLPEWSDYWRYLLVTLLITEGWPQLAGRR